MKIDEIIQKHKLSDSEEEWLQRMVSMMMVFKKHTLLNQHPVGEVKVYD